VSQYLLQIAYTPEAWASMVANPQNRLDAVQPSIERLGGKLEQGWLCFGDYDLIALMSLPNDINAAAFSLAVSAGGAVKSIKTTPLLSMEQGVEAMRKAAIIGYHAPHNKSQSA
jgi:uncharacterized protein with GYD domain